MPDKPTKLSGNMWYVLREMGEGRILRRRQGRGDPWLSHTETVGAESVAFNTVLALETRGLIKEVELFPTNTYHLTEAGQALLKS